ncbi:MAG: bifunctional 4-hydroxy-2-oxoglutarate aldolase/2-dehydro-3-deoxy-phosphogluconate aldolase [Candidatus Caenarcaniphilales bacterium]|nr:bifunctional 4-hydroxy-2-oxoglutarate aldolase/2-dehydro-3-deoxy-phosphogluconate aldolase [Candidatus Caenarcaniphilales bacterium]
MKDFRQTIAIEKLIVIIRPVSLEQGQAHFQALVKAGVKLIEIASNKPFSKKLLSWARLEAPEICLGAATIFNQDQIRFSKEVGLNFTASPIARPDLIDCASSLDIPLVAGVTTANEIAQTLEHPHVDHLKLFPAPDRRTFASLKKIFPRVNFILSSFEVSSLPDYLISGNEYFMIGTFLDIGEPSLSERLELIRSMLQTPYSSPRKLNISKLI